MALFVLHLTVFLAAFLLFQIELIIAKMFLPVYGGSYAVWGACLVFFQVVLLWGYIFVHALTKKLGMAKYRVIQVILVALPLLFFPGKKLAVAGSAGNFFLSLDVFLKLLVAIGPVFFVLSTLGVALQKWLAASSLKEKANPYVLYATSNLGSLAALLTYPLLFDIVFDLRQQEQIWRAGYFLLAALSISLYLSVPVSNQAGEEEKAAKAVSRNAAVIWFLLGVAGVMAFMAVTNIITYALIPVPLLWIIPLTIYLSAFILSFKARPWCPEWVMKGKELILIGSSGLFLLLYNKTFSPVWELLIFSFALFLLCLYSQNQLSRHRPAAENDLTRFYVVISLGGCVGGIFTSWIMPLISRSVIEYLLAICILVIVTWMIEKERGALSPGTLWWGRVRLYSLIVVPLFLGAAWFFDFQHGGTEIIHRTRNYYGIYEVRESNGLRFLSHGATMHGAQLQDPRFKLEPSAFFSRTSPVGEIFLSSAFNFRNIGVIGLGAGTLAIYTRAHQVMDFYELDPDMYAIAKNYFSYLDNAPGEVNFIYGDGRLSLDKATGKRYDFLIIDAFGGDAIPFHLLTVEAIAKYRQHLNEHGLILFHISNRYVRLAPVLAKLSEEAGAYAGWKASMGSPFGCPSVWCALTWDEGGFRKLVSGLQWVPLAHALKERHRVWTDAYFNILPVIDAQELKREIFR